MQYIGQIMFPITKSTMIKSNEKCIEEQYMIELETKFYLLWLLYCICFQ